MNQPAPSTHMIGLPPWHPELQPHLEKIWRYQSEGPRVLERVLPNGRMQLLINLVEDRLCNYASDGSARSRVSGVGLQGPTADAVTIDTDQKRLLVGVLFTPGGLQGFHSILAKTLRNRLIDGEALWPGHATNLRMSLLRQVDNGDWQALVEDFFLRRLRPPDPDRQLLADVTTALARGVSVGTVQQRFGLSQRALHRLFDARIGLTPKLYARTVRLRSTAAAMGERTSWSDLSATQGFADQAHMIREFRDRAGATPATYQPSSPNEPGHSIVKGG